MSFATTTILQVLLTTGHRILPNPKGTGATFRHNGITSATNRIATSRLVILLVVVFTTVFSANRATTQAFQLARQHRHRCGHHYGKGATIPATLRGVPHADPPSASMSTSRLAATISLKEYLQGELDKGTIDAGLVDVMLALAKSCAEVSFRLQTLSLGLFEYNGGDGKEVKTMVNVQGEQQKGMDVVANDIFITNLGLVDSVVAMASEEEDSVIVNRNRNINHSENASRGSGDSNTNSAPSIGYEIAFDPLDGSGNLDVNLPTGSIFGIAPCQNEGINDDYDDDDDTEPAFFSRPGSALRAAGYAVYSSSTELVLTLGTDHPDGVLGFTLDPALRTTPEDAFVLSRSSIRCPDSGPYYSLNEARAPDWPRGLQKWISDAKHRKTPTKQLYSARYVCSLCADVHRTLLQGGWAGNPRPHLRLLYEAAPLALVLEAAGGRGSDGVQDLLEIRPEGLHDRVPVFLGSRAEIVDLVEIYGDVQQIEFKRYEA